jgi:RalA-binding protein 1
MASSSTNGLAPHPPGMPAGFATPMRPSRTTEAITSSTMRSAQGSTPPTGPPSAHPSAPLTMDAVLETHATNPSPAYAGLETTISERNLLSSQNFQLWKLIEKQRSGYTSVLKDLERIRAERDAYKSALQSMGIDTESIRKGKGDPHRSKPSSAAAVMGVAGGASAVPARVGMVRRQSDDNST